MVKTASESLWGKNGGALEVTQSTMSPESFKFSLLLSPMVRAPTLLQPELISLPLELREDVRVSKPQASPKAQHSQVIPQATKGNGGHSSVAGYLVGVRCHPQHHKTRPRPQR